MSLGYVAQGAEEIGKMPDEESCMGLIAVLPTFRSDAMAAWYEKSNKSGLSSKQVVEKIESLAEGGNALFGARSPTCTKCGAGMFSDILGYKFGASCQDCPTG